MKTESYKVEMTPEEVKTMIKSLLIYKCEIYDCLQRTKNEDTWNELETNYKKASELERKFRIIEEPPF